MEVSMVAPPNQIAKALIQQQLIPKKKATKPAFDMGSILLDDSIDGGMAPSVDPDSSSLARQIIPVSDYSLDGESAMVWGDDPEKAYFAYMMERDAEQRALDGKDTDDSLVGESIRQELMNQQPEDEVTFDGDSTTLGHGSKAMGWEPSTAIESSNVGNVSSLTPSQLAGSQEQRDKNGKVVPGFIYLQDGNDPGPEHQDVKEQAPTKGSRFFGGFRRNSAAQSNSVPKQLDDEPDNANNANISDRENKSGFYTNRILICFALFFLILTTSLVAALVIYRNNHAEETASVSSNLDENGNPIVSPTQAPVIRNPRTFAPTLSIGKKEEDDEFIEDEEEDEDDDDPEVLAGPVLTAEPTWLPTSEPTWVPTETPTFKPTRVPSAAPTSNPSLAPTETPSLQPTETPSIQPTRTASRNPTAVPSVSPTNATYAPTSEPTR